MIANNSVGAMKQAKPLSKSFYLSSIITACVIGTVLSVLGVLQLEEDFGPLILAIGLLFVICASIIWLILLHKLWALIQGEQARTTPGKAVGFMFIPFFSFYWIFQAIWGWAQDFNRFTTENKLSVPRVSESVALTFCILILVSIVPFVGILSSVGSLVLFIIFMVQAINAVNATRQELVQSGHPYSSRIKLQKLLTPRARKRRRIAWLVGLIGVPVLIIILVYFYAFYSGERESDAFNTFLRYAQDQVEFYRPLLVQLCTEIDPNTSPQVSQKFYQTIRAMERRPVGQVYVYMKYVGDDYTIWKYWCPFPRNAPGRFKEKVVSLYVEKAALSALRGDSSLIDAFNEQTHYSWNEILYDSQKRAVAVVRLPRWGYGDDYEERMIDLPSQKR